MISNMKGTKAIIVIWSQSARSTHVQWNQLFLFTGELKNLIQRLLSFSHAKLNIPQCES